MPEAENVDLKPVSYLHLIRTYMTEKGRFRKQTEANRHRPRLDPVSTAQQDPTVGNRITT